MNRPGTADRTDALIVVFAKCPRPGQVKTRLIGRVSAAQAAEIHETCLRYTIAVTSTLEIPTWLAHAPDDADFAPYLPPQVICVPQGSGDLGERLTRVARRAFESGYRTVAFIGTDCPTLCAEDLRVALTSGSESTISIGPAADGGYYLLAIRAFEPTLFQGIDWSSSRVLEQTRDRAAAKGLDVEWLTQRSDLDTPEDLDRFLGRAGDATETEALRQAIRAIVNQGDARATD